MIRCKSKRSLKTRKLKSNNMRGKNLKDETEKKSHKIQNQIDFIEINSVAFPKTWLVSLGFILGQIVLRCRLPLCAYWDSALVCGSVSALLFPMKLDFLVIYIVMFDQVMASIHCK